MSDTNPSAPSAEDEYYSAGSYQRGSNTAAAVAAAVGQQQAPPPSTSNDQAYAKSLQDQEYRNAQQQQQQQLQQQQQAIAAAARPVRPVAAGTQYVAIFPSSTPFDPADLGVAGGFITPREARLLEVFSLGRTIKMLAILDGLILVLNCIYWPTMLVLLFWAPASGWMAGTRFSITWTYVYCCYYVFRISMDLAYIIDGVMWAVVTFVVHLIIARYILSFAKMLNTLSPAEIEQLRSPSAVYSNQYRRQPEQPFQSL